jgi:hypothetical protein
VSTRATSACRGVLLIRPLLVPLWDTPPPSTRMWGMISVGRGGGAECGV